MPFGALVAFGLLLIRTGTLVATTPILGSSYAPAPIKIGLSVLLTIVLVPVVAVPATLSGGSLVLVAAREFAVGAALAMSIRVLVAAAEMGGYLIGFQLGFSYAGIVDPQSGVRNNVLAALYASLTVLMLVVVNAHHTIIRALAESYEAIPIGAGALQGHMGATVAAMLGVVFSVGLQLAAPVIIVLCFIEILLGIVTRAAPALNLMVLGAPVRLLVGLGALVAAIGIVPGLMVSFLHRVLELAVRLAMALR
jgi:flagellar biosynthetic protein FliR